MPNSAQLTTQLNALFQPGTTFWDDEPELPRLLAGLDTITADLAAQVAGGKRTRASLRYASLIERCIEKQIYVGPGAPLAPYLANLTLAWLDTRPTSHFHPADTSWQLLGWMERMDLAAFNLLVRPIVAALDEDLTVAYAAGLDMGLKQSLDFDPEHFFVRVRMTRALCCVYEGEVWLPESFMPQPRLSWVPEEYLSLARVRLARGELDAALHLLDLTTLVAACVPTPNGLAEFRGALLKRLDRLDSRQEAALDGFLCQHSPLHLDALLSSAWAAGDWPKYRARLLAVLGFIRPDGAARLLGRINADPAILKRLNDTPDEALARLGYALNDTLGAALSEHHPAQAARFFAAAGTCHINAYGATRYKKANHSFARARDGFIKADQSERWDALAAHIRATHKRRTRFMPGFEHVATSPA